MRDSRICRRARHRSILLPFVSFAAVMPPSSSAIPDDFERYAADPSLRRVHRVLRRRAFSCLCI